MSQHPDDLSDVAPGPGPVPSSVHSLLVIRPGGLGDVVRTIPALRHLRATFPDARISCAVSAPAHPLIEDCPYVDRVIDLDQPSEALLERFDVAISCAHPADAAGLRVAQVHAHVRASWRLAGDAPARGVIQPVWPDRLDDRSRMLRLAWLLGGTLHADTGMGLWPKLADRNGAARLVAGEERPLAIVHTGAGEAARRWPIARWVRVIDVIEQSGMSPVLVGTVVELDRTAEIVEATRCSPTSLVAQTSVGELVGLLERAALFVGSDSGPAALAGVVGARSVIIGPGSRFEHEPRPGRVDIVDAGACEQCGEHACEHPVPPASAVPLDAVLSRVELAAVTAVRSWQSTRIA